MITQSLLDLYQTTYSLIIYIYIYVNQIIIACKNIGSLAVKIIITGVVILMIDICLIAKTRWCLSVLRYIRTFLSLNQYAKDIESDIKKLLCLAILLPKRTSSLTEDSQLNLTMKCLCLGLSFIPLGIVHADSDGVTLENTVPTFEEFVVTGSRGKPRSVSESPVPIDVFTSETIEGVAHIDTHDVMMTLLPSYQVNRFPISDGESFVRPAQLRGMSTDKTLVLVNSRRRHRAVLVDIGAAGTQGADLATIPTIALERIEVLRDGAAAQYGSDAIAGVINFILKDNADGGSINFEAGSFYDGDGDQAKLAFNKGLPLGGRGFFNLSGELSNADRTDRAEQYCETWFCLDPGNPVYNPSAAYTTYTNDPAFMAAVSEAGDVVQAWGRPQTKAVRLFINAGYEVDDYAKLYAFGSFSKSEGKDNFFYRYPGNGTIEDLRLQDGSIYNPISIFPGGFTPQFTGDITDYSLVAGFKGLYDNGLTYDYSARFGSNTIAYTLDNTINPSLGPDTPQSFKPGEQVNEELQIQADFTYEFDVGLVNPAFLAFGASYMDESYEIIKGDAKSYEVGPYAKKDPWGFCNAGAPTAAGTAVIAGGSTLNCANTNDPVFRVVGVGSNGFPGYSPEYSEETSRDSWALYADLSSDITEQLFLQGALRYEDYSDFGSELIGKLAARYAITDSLAVRGSLGTGFRAPTPGQQGTTSVVTRLPDGFPVATGLFPANSAVAQALGASPLKPEKSKNFTLGMSFSHQVMDVTLDFYRIELTDRIYSRSNLPVSSDSTAGAAFNNYQTLVNAGVPGANSIGGVFYFTNAFDSVTQGVDLVTTIPVEWENASSTLFTISANYNRTKFDSDPSAYLNEQGQFNFENYIPRWRSVFSATHSIGDWSYMGRLNLYGPYKRRARGDIQKYDEEALLDLEVRYQFDQNLTFALGGLNVLNEYPDKDEIGNYCCGRVYSSNSPVSWQGGSYYLKLMYKF